VWDNKAVAELNKYKHMLVVGEYAPREKVVSGLTLEQATKAPAKGLHTIYDELWHTAKWQKIVADSDQDLYEQWNKGAVYPAKQAETQEEWDELVNEFLSDLNRVFEMTLSQEQLERVTEQGIKWGEDVDTLAMHTAYHFGKIVTMRQLMGCWPSNKK
jgi:hypothetical protein